jgi:hypothetical protein
MVWVRARTADVPGPDIALSPDARIDPGPVLGSWVNYDRNTIGIARLRIRVRAEDIGVTILEAGSLGPATNAEAAGSVFGGAVTGFDATGFSARLRFDGNDVLLAAYLNGRLLVVDAYAVDPARRGYFHRDHLYLP